MFSFDGLQKLISLYTRVTLLHHDVFCYNNTKIKTKKGILKYLFGKDDYDPSVSPDFEKDHATRVNIQIYVQSFDAVTETTMDLSMNIFLRMSWNDQRLKYEGLNTSSRIEVGYNTMDKIWVPDLYFRNEKKAHFHKVTVPNKFMHLHPNGDVRYSMRLSLTLICRMKLNAFPLDTQNCPVLLESYTHMIDKVMFYWMDTNGSQPIYYDKEMDLATELPQFSIIHRSTSACNGTTDIDTDKYTCLRASFVFKRNVGHYMRHVYISSALIVVFSWVSFWLDPKAVPARITLGVLSVLTLFQHNERVQRATPKVSYLKAINVWEASSFIFVLAAVIEFAYVNILKQRQKLGSKAKRISKNVFVNTNGNAGGRTSVLSNTRVHRQTTVLSNTQLHHINAQSIPNFTSTSATKANPDDYGEICNTFYEQNEIDTNLQELDDTNTNEVTADSSAIGLCDSKRNSHQQSTEDCPHMRASRVDEISRIAFPACYFIFNVIYWTFYLRR